MRLWRRGAWGCWNRYFRTRGSVFASWLRSGGTAAAVLSLALVAGLESFAGRGKGCWVWGPTRLGWTWYGTPVTGFVGWGTTALLILAFATPALINKRPKELGPDYSSVAHWVLLDILFVAGAAEHQYWLAALFGSGTVLGVVCLALHGARR